MTKYFHIISIYLILLGGLFACSEDFLDRPPLTKPSNDMYWQKASDLDNYVLQFYDFFPSFGKVGSYTGLIGWDGTRGSDLQIVASPSVLWNGTSQPITTGGSWDWTSIRNVNLFFDNYAKCKDPFDQYKHFVGEAHFFKAWFYFEKVKAYGDVPWYSKSLDINSPELYNPRDPRNVVVDSILYHLDRAIELMKPLANVVGGNNRLSKEAALLFKSRVALFEGTWQKYHAGTVFGTLAVDPNIYFQAAVSAAEELMKSQYGRKIYSNGDTENDYCKLFSLKNHNANAEVILYKSYAVALNLSHSFQIYVSDRTAGNSMTLQQVLHYLGRNGQPYDYVSVSQTTKGRDFLSKIAADCDPRLKQTVWTPGGLMWDNTYGVGIFKNPFLDKSGEYLNNTGFQIRKGNDPKDPTAGSGVSWNTSSETGSIVFRYAEALLNYAEAKAELGQTVDYNASINLLRKRVGMPDFAVQNDLNRSRFADYGYNLSNELYEIRRERAVELAAEGFRFDDIRRWAAHKLLLGKRPKGYPFLASDFPGVSIKYAKDSEGFLDPYVTVLPAGYGFKKDRDYLECIPLNEITLNENLKPNNPGW